MTLDWPLLLRYLLILSGISLVLAAVAGVWVWKRVKRLRLPEDAGFVEALSLTPLSVVILLDLLDMGLDIFSAPITWVLLGRLGLRPLRNVTAAEAVIPGTQFLPTMTAAWLAVRWLGGARVREVQNTVEGEAQVID